MPNLECNNLNMLYFPVAIRFSKKCDRCGQRYPKKEKQCVHCSSLPDSELDNLRKTLEEEHLANSNLGGLFFYIAAIIVVFMVIYLISKYI